MIGKIENQFLKVQAFFQIELKRFFLYPYGLAVSVFLISIRQVFASSIFDIMRLAGQISSTQVNQLLWAVLIAQILNRSMLRVHEDIRQDIRFGDIQIRLSEPVNYILAKLSKTFGYFLPHFITLSLVFITPFLFIFPTEISLPLLFLCSLFSFFIYQFIEILVGLSSFILEENEGVYWIFSKLYIVFGNQIIPIQLMPAYVISFAQSTPFYLSMAGPVEIASGRVSSTMSLSLSLGYIIFFFLVSQFLLKKLEKRLILNG
jgi:ABC-type uncharacterized transport system permease subunit